MNIRSAIAGWLHELAALVAPREVWTPEDTKITVRKNQEPDEDDGSPLPPAVLSPLAREMLEEATTPPGGNPAEDEREGLPETGSGMDRLLRARARREMG